MMFLPLAELEAGLDRIRRTPTESGAVELIVRRPSEDQREVLAVAELDVTAGLVGDAWLAKGASLGRQITVMNVRVVEALSPDRARWPLAGDQLYVQLDLSEENTPPGTRLAVGSAELEVSVEPHRGCKKFAARFGVDALRFVNSPAGRAMNLRGINARVVRSGRVAVGDQVSKIAPASR